MLTQTQDVHEVVWRGDSWRQFPTRTPPAIATAPPEHRAPRPKTLGVANHRELVLAAVSSEPEPVPVIAARAGVCRQTAATWLASLRRAGQVVATDGQTRRSRPVRRYVRAAVVPVRAIPAGKECIACGSRWANEGRLCRGCARACGEMRTTTELQSAEARA
jgi:transposase